MRPSKIYMILDDRMWSLCCKIPKTPIDEGWSIQLLSCGLQVLQLSFFNWSIRFTAPTRINHKTRLIVQSFIYHNYPNFFNFSSAIYPVYECIISKKT